MFNKTIHFFDVYCFVGFRVGLRFSCALRIPTSLGVGSGKQICGGKTAAQHILSPNATCFAPQIIARTNQFTSISYGAPEKRLLFPPNRTKLHFIDLSVQSGCRTNTFLERRQAGSKPGSVWSCNGLLWAGRLPADKWSISPARTGPEGLPLPWTHKPVSNPQFRTGICPDSRYFGSSDARCHLLSSGTFQRGLWVIMQRKLLKPFLEERRTAARHKLDYLKSEVLRPWMEFPPQRCRWNGINHFHLSAPGLRKVLLRFLPPSLLFTC